MRVLKDVIGTFVLAAGTKDLDEIAMYSCSDKEHMVHH